MKNISCFCFLFWHVIILTACGGTQATPTSNQPPPLRECANSCSARTYQCSSIYTLNLYAWSEYVPQQLLDDFSAKYGITVNYDTYSSNEEMLAKLQAGASGYDVIIPSDYTVAIMIKQDMLETIDVSKLVELW